MLTTQGATQLYARAYGYASRAWRVPNTLDTRFDTASVTKLFTAIATLQLIDRGLLTFDTPVVERLGLEGTTLLKEVNVLHLLSHTSGIGDDADEEAGERYEELFSATSCGQLRESDLAKALGGVCRTPNRWDGDTARWLKSR